MRHSETKAGDKTRPLDPSGATPLHSHATYTLSELVAGYGVTSKGVLVAPREGLLYVPAETDLFFVTLNKSDEDYSPTTRIPGLLPISPTLFHWESQSRAAVASVTAQRYINHEIRGSKILLCVRENRRDARDVANPYVCLGYARMVSHRI